MNRALLTPQRLLIASVLLLTISVLLPVRYADRLAAMPRWVVSHLLAPATGPLTWMSARVRAPAQIPSGIAADPSFEQNYDAMRQYAIDLEMEVEQLRQQLSDLAQVPLDTRRAVTFVPARVVAAPTDRLDPVMTINRGRSHGVEPNMIVSSGYNLVGLVVSVDHSQARVRLITSPQSSVSVTLLSPLAPPGGEGLRSKLRLDRDKARFFADARRQDPIQPGDLAHLYDAAWPREAAGYVVGQVTQIIDNPDDPILRRVAIVEPRLQLNFLTQVYVVVPKE